MKRIKKILRRCVEKLLTAFYPYRCPFCGKLTGTDAIKSCLVCEKKLLFIKNPRCLKCGKEVAEEETEYCMDCAQKKHYFTEGISLWSYSELSRKAVHRFKYKNCREYAAYFARELMQRYYLQIKQWDADAIIPVPIHKKRYKKRGYNQAELIAVAIGRYMKLPVDTEIITRIKNTKPQKELNDKQRIKNLKKAFKINKNGVKLKKVIIVDDIYTTGATIDTIAELLLQRTTITHVYVITVCIGKGY